MSTPLARFQSDFARALFAPAPGSDALAAQPAFAVYRNTVMKACIDALQANFPAVARLVGNDWFRAAAAIHVADQPPQDARMLQYGSGFADFLDRFEPARELPYLSGVARLDRHWTEVHGARDAATGPGWLAGLAPEALGRTHLAPHPAARWRWFEDVPVYSIWSRNRQAEVDDSEMAWQGEGALLTRIDGVVQWRPASRADCAFLDTCIDGAPLLDAAAAALQAEPDVDLAGLLAGLLGAGALVQFHPANPGATP